MPIVTTIGYAYAKQTVSSTALPLASFTGFAAVAVTDASRLTLSVETNSVRYRYDGGAPTASEGHLLAAGDTLVMTGQHNIQQLQVIRATGSDGTVLVTLER